MKGFPSREQVERLRQQYPKGTKIFCDYMSDDPRSIPPGTIGEVVGVDFGGVFSKIGFKEAIGDALKGYWLSFSYL